MSTVLAPAATMRVELHGRDCSCRGGSWVVLGDASASPCPGGRETAALVVELAEWRTLGKRAEVTYVSAPAADGDRMQRLGLRFLDAPLPDELIPAGAKLLP